MMINFIVLVIVWFFSNFSYVLIVRRLKYYNNQIMSVKFNPWLETCNLIVIQFGYLRQIVKWLLDKEQQKQLQQLKSNALQKVIYNLNQTLTNDLSIKTTQPSTTNGVEVWVYLANKLDSATETKLEDYFSGVLSKYTQEFALDILVIEQIAGAGWVAKFDVKPVAEAQYNRMARASEVVQEEKFDEDLDIW
ncbi:hypothetical protein KP778_04115 [Streptococcus equi subsp. zooepidemicus]|uniref:hypothetical protein n=1 Tax=Streptococcus equi TaxID=1336 RepID=UPI001E4F09B9|nr:hypothetical protein [Streptococcus equi]MCD3428458.1 hypothetical protein [Streptococcus equi subsp. zooepidemicus]MCD3463109.1 hypothetical protein [Streptococcus equi subsp. zooepidemicus]MDI5915180.1 hypothetical protein [Streptococcus equi subsp. zooepidemicus]HEL0720236.1 hypothetical protein [Streptococcus equi subsp. zooepidemicus]HEL0743729.1 hypothetical protein [Streptococcus equi subsp. zooepidemicus]